MKMIDGDGPGATNQLIDFVEKNLRVKFPEEFIACIKQADTGVPEKCFFEFVDPSTEKMRKEETGAFLSFEPSKEDNILRTYFTRPDFFPQTLLPFAGDGDYLCFDYSIDGFEDKDPPVVFWLHDYPEGKEVVDLAINFKEFLEKLKPDEEI